MPKAIIGRKLGMTQIFTPTGDCVAVTVVKVGPCTVVRKKSVDGKDGYNALVLGFEDVRSAQVDGETVYKMNRPELGVFKAAGVEPCKSLHEVRVSAADLDKYEVGQKVNADTFFPGEVIDVIGTSKGSGFTGRHETPQLRRRQAFTRCPRIQTPRWFDRYDVDTGSRHEKPQNGWSRW